MVGSDLSSLIHFSWEENEKRRLCSRTLTSIKYDSKVLNISSMEKGAMGNVGTTIIHYIQIPID